MVSELSVWLLSSNKVSKKSHMASSLLESVSDLLEVYLSLTYKKVYLNSQNGLWHIRKCLRTLRLASDLSESAIIWFYAYLNSYIFFLDDSKYTELDVTGLDATGGWLSLIKSLHSGTDLVTWPPDSLYVPYAKGVTWCHCNSLKE